jgi:Pyruvate-formate lyase-activating enzyme
MKQAMFYDKLDENKVKCTLCPHECSISSGNIGRCRARKNMNGELYSLNYARLASIALDPIEKKPLFRFHPGSRILSAGTFGCNLKCAFCQNWSISQVDADTIELMPEELVEKAIETQKLGNIGLAYTYNEPSIWYEYILESASLAKDRGLLNVLVTNGFISEEPLTKLLPYIDAMNIDVKAFNSKFYQEICKGGFESVISTVEHAAKQCHIEITTLLIPGLNDSEKEIEELSKWLSNISNGIPLHLTRFFPNYKMTDRPPTPVSTIYKARDIALKWLKYVYIGNV